MELLDFLHELRKTLRSPERDHFANIISKAGKRSELHVVNYETGTIEQNLKLVS